MVEFFNSPPVLDQVLPLSSLINSPPRVPRKITPDKDAIAVHWLSRLFFPLKILFQFFPPV
jgi:hypothetical protein